MKLFFKPGACSLATHIVLNEIDETFELDGVDTNTGTTNSGLNYKTINPKGYVPALQLDSGEVLTEGAAILQYLADTHADAGLAPKPGTIERARLQEHLNFTGSELHKAFSPFFQAAATDVEKLKAGENVAVKFDYLETLLSDGRDYLLGDRFSVADAYLFVVSNWSHFVGVDLRNWPNVAAFVDRVARRPAAQASMKAEGLL